MFGTENAKFAHEWGGRGGRCKSDSNQTAAPNSKARDQTNTFHGNSFHSMVAERGDLGNAPALPQTPLYCWDIDVGGFALQKKPVLKTFRWGTLAVARKYENRTRSW